MFFWLKFHEKADSGIKNDPRCFPVEKTAKLPWITRFSENIDPSAAIIDFFQKKISTGYQANE